MLRSTQPPLPVSMPLTSLSHCLLSLNKTGSPPLEFDRHRLGQDVFPAAHDAPPTGTPIAHNGPRVYEPATRARQLRSCLSATAVNANCRLGDGTALRRHERLRIASAVTEPGMDRAPSDDQREERCVNALLYALAVLGGQSKGIEGQPIRFWGSFFYVFVSPNSQRMCVHPLPNLMHCSLL